MSTTRGSRHGVLAIGGYGVRLAVERGHLVVDDGVADQRTSQRISRVRPGFQRLVVVGHSGTITLGALRWLHDVGIALIHLDNDGTLLTVSGPRGIAEQATLRAQAAAVDSDVGLAIAQELLQQKVSGQLDLLGRMREAHPKQKQEIADCLATIEATPDVDTLRRLEARAAKAYWDAWEDLPITFGKRDRRDVPSHWLTFGTRHSPLTGSPRSAVNPANAMLNYLYALLEAESRLAALALGLDPALGLMHADQRWRDSLACDLMEPIRPMVDVWLLRALYAKALRRADFFENRQGLCRVMPPLTQTLGATTRLWRKRAGPVAEHVAKLLHRSGQRRRPVNYRAQTPAQPTPLTGDNRRRGRAQPPAEQTGGRSARRKRTVRERHKELLRWRSDNFDRAKPDASVFRTEILPRLQGVGLRELANATGLSRAYCCLIRNGEKIPHPRHWDVLRSTITQD